MRREVRWERMFPDELEAAFEECPIVYFCYGLCEPHGPQNAVGLDTLKAHGIACQTAREYGGIVAPPDYWHIHEHGGYASWAYHNVGEVRSWLTAMPAWQHFKNVCYHIRAADALGFEAAIFLTGHYGPNWQDLKTLLDIVQQHFAMRLYGLPDFEANESGFDRDGKSSGDHAGKVETSLLWALEPECVDVSRLPDPDAPGPHFAMGKNAPESNRLIGAQMVADEVQWLGAKAKDLLDEYAQLNPTRQPLTFDRVEEIWERDVRPQLKDLKSLQDFRGDREPPPEDSQWYAQWRVPDRG